MYGFPSSFDTTVFYSGPRFAVYDLLKTKFSNPDSTSGLPLWQTVPMAAVAGAIGAMIGNPCDLAMVRLQADSNRPFAERRNYRNVFDALYRVTRYVGFFSLTGRDEGILTLWRGVGPTVSRAMLVTVGHLAAYDQIKYSLIATSKHLILCILTHFASFFCGKC
jgi:solute carrier family 25 oxoglutarate transporter 11